MITHTSSDKYSHKNLPALNSLRCFEAAARFESFSKAADSLNLTHGAVSRQVRQLEDSLGYALFERHHRQVRLNEAGRHIQAAVTQSFDILANAMAEARTLARPRELVLSCEPTLLMRWLIPRVADLHLKRPDLKLHLLSGGGAFSFAADGIDLAIRRNDFEKPPEADTHLIMHEWIGPVCTPAMAKSIETPAHLSALPWLHTRTRAGAWQDWQVLKGATGPGKEDHWFDHFYYSIQAALSGLGVAIAPYAFVRDEISAGTLTAPFGFLQDGTGYYLLTRKAQEMDERLAYLLDWLRGGIANPPASSSHDRDQRETDQGETG